uniref:GH07323p (inferred by orthology to a D. melanogaster protein) n=1 Tax=Strongyloides venezuelensis TaxID=75913 RepID=A0A0K0F0W4_STRVS
MIIGMTLQNVEYLKSVFIIFPYYLEVTRLSAVIFVLLRTSLTINYNELKKYWKKAFFAGVPPTILGYISLILLTYFLFKTPLIISLSYAFVIGATGPAVPLFMSKILIDKKLGLHSGIGQIWRLSTSMDNILSIISLNIILDYAFSFNNYSFLHSLVHIVLGIGIGFLFSIIYWYYPFNTNLPFFSTTRTLMILGSCGGLLFYFKTIGYYSTPVIGILIFSFVAGIKYKRDSTDEIYSNEHSYIDNLWFNIFEPYLFIITGYHCDFRNYNWVNFINSLLIVIFAILTKILFGIISTWFLKLKRNEKIFLSLSLIPRSSIQAANAIMIMNLTNDSEISKDGKNFYLTTITSLLLPAIFSQWIYYYLGNKLLKRFTIDDLKIQNVVVLEDKNSI